MYLTSRSNIISVPIILSVSIGKCYLFLTIILLSLSFIFPKDCFAQQNDQVKVMAYNLLNYGGSGGFAADTTLRNPFYRTSINTANPDILVVEEISTQAGLNSILTKVLNAQANVYSAGSFVDGPDSDNGIFYKTAKFQFISNIPVHTDLRDISEFTLLHLASGDTLRIYAVHLKASTGSANELQRAVEIDSLRKRTDALPIGSKFIICGDFNIYNSTESSYIKLLQIHSGVEGHFVDPINLTGTWNNPSYSNYHTQSTRGVHAFGGGSIGGLDDRFDMILFSKAIQQGGRVSYVANSLTAYGNDGNHYNDSINKMPNAAVSQAVADALYQGSDHLPVLSSFNFNYSSIDVGLTAFTNPLITPCSNTNKKLIVTIKNYASLAIDFAINNVQINLSATNPLSITQNFSKIINTGTLTPGASITIIVDSTFNMSSNGNYIFNAATNNANDLIIANNAMPTVTLNVTTSQSVIPTISPAGPISICNGSSVVLNATSGASYLWSNGATSQSISITTATNYSVIVSDIYGCTAIANSVVATVVNPVSAGIVFHENMGSAPSTILIPAHESANGFESVNLTMSGTADVRNTSASSGYTGASGTGNIFFSTTTIGKNFIISNINSSGLSGLALTFAINKGNNLTNGSELLVKVSADGINYTSLSFPPVNTTAWTLVTATGTIPATTNLRIQFIQNGTNTSHRIDDVVLKYSILPIITVSGTTTICAGDSIRLTSSSGSNYLWNTGATTQSIYAKTSGSYSVLTDCISSAAVALTVNNCNAVLLNFKTFIQGFYNNQTHLMNPVLYDAGLSSDPTACDSVTVDFYTSITPTFVYSQKALLHINGNAFMTLPGFLSGQMLYITIRHRNSIETWSKNAVLFTNASASTVTFDFSF